MKRVSPMEPEKSRACCFNDPLSQIVPVQQVFADNRGSTVTQRQLKAAMANSPRMVRQRLLKHQLHNSERIQAHREMLSGFPVGMAQRYGYQYQPVQLQALQLQSDPKMLMQFKKITAAAPSLGALRKKRFNNWVHFNIQMSGDSRMAVAGVGLANQNETKNYVYNGLMVSVPKDTEHDKSTDADYIDQKLYGLLSTHSVKDKTEVYATAASNPHESRQESLNTWKGKSESEPHVYQTGKIEELINWYEQSKYGNSLKDQLIKNYGHDDVETSLGKKLKSLNSAGNAVLWFKGDPSESGAINSLQTAKTEHWLSAGAGNTIISKIAKGSKYAIAGSLADGMKVALAGNLTSDNQFTVDKLNEAGYTNLGKQYGFFYQYSDKMTHFGGRSGHLEPIAAMGIKTVYFEEEGNSQAGRTVGMGKNNAMNKVVVSGVGGLGGVISKALSWMQSNGKYYGGKRGPSVDQATLMDNIVRQWLKLDLSAVIGNAQRKEFYEKFVAKTSGIDQHRQDKDETLRKNSERFKDQLSKAGHLDLSALEGGVFSDDDVDKIVKSF
ncbi:hypothetical protein [Nitrosomonas sp.]|uniref:hypothetical protein n=1 Tax=Nitrosomonas sp. TaxID=42353 RepID=UPI001D2BA9DC|nr:hypothetical protein [Nitrosomonas sp.]MBX3616320.1 hypothetical protein [Nitrosomonas sp.]